jgi:hypothetical protein
MSSHCIKRVSFILGAVLYTLVLTAQGLHFPDDNQLDFGSDRINFCKPGVINKTPGKGILLERTFLGGYDINPRENSNDGQAESSVSYIDKTKIKVKAPLVNAPGLKMLFGYEYNAETFHFNEISGPSAELFHAINHTPLRSNRLSIYVTKSFNEKYYGGLRMRMSSRGNYEKAISFEDQFRTFSATGLFGIKVREDLEWGIGLTYSDNFARKQIWPFAIYNQTFNDQWGIEAVLPASIMMRYNVRPQSILLFGVALENSAYAINAPMRPETPYYFRHTEIGTKAVFTQHLFSWVWMSAEAGALIPMRNRFEDARDPINVREYNRAGIHPFCRFGIFLSPPKHLSK